MTLKLYYDAEFDILHLAQDGIEDEVVEIHPGITLELDCEGALIGIEVLGASTLLKDSLLQFVKLANRSPVELTMDMNEIDALLRPRDGKGCREYFDSFAEHDSTQLSDSEALISVRQTFAAVWKQTAHITPSY